MMNGFKSFADKIEIDFGAGITGIVGPNGCGKSNVSDAIKWVLGEQSYKAVRGSSMQDVIFKGTANRKMQSYAEVALVFDNRTHVFEIDETEVTISRKLYRDGESEYALNGQPTRLKDIKNLLHDSGIDPDGMTIISQGQVADLVSAKPENRRSIFEEAAGIAKFRARKDEAERKLDRTTQELVRVSDVLNEIERNLGPLMKQAEKAQKYLQLKEELKHLEINLFIYKYDHVAEEKAKSQAEADKLDKELKELQGQLEMMDRASANGMQELSALDKKVADLRDQILALSLDSQRQSGEQLLYQATADSLHQAELQREQLLSKKQMIANIIDSGEGFKYSVKKLIEERNRNSAVARAIVGVVSQELSVPSELETAIEMALGAAAQNIITHDEEDAKELVHLLASKNLGRATFLPITAVKARDIKPDERAILRGMGKRVLGVASELIEYKPEIAGVVSNLLGRVIVCDNLDSAIALSRQARYAFKVVTLDGDIIEPRGSITGGSKNAVTNTLWHTNNLKQIEAQLVEVDRNITELREKLGQLKVDTKDNHVTEAQKRLEQLKDELAKTLAERDNLHYATGTSVSGRTQLSERINELQVKYYYATNLLTRMDAEIENLSQRIAEEYNLNYSSCYEQRDPEFNIETAEPRVNELRRVIQHLGNVNLDAIEQVKTDSERYESYKAQSDDLFAAKQDLEKVMRDLSQQMEKNFKTAFEQINKNFGIVFQELFGGGSAKLLLTDEENFLECGIDIIAEPPGKKLANISLMSGGEKALTAIAILFAILRYKTMPFCLLDEIEAALDDANVARFASYLHHFSGETQFIVITHRKPTMELADRLYGITMEEKGISKIVSVKLS
ncbi:MAG: AAA family ATPase [Eubacteriales bacterium]|nr:AAA family ATPase [Eubacteriales bacterium]